MSSKSVIPKDLRVLPVSILSIADSITYDFSRKVTRKSVILNNLKSFRIILLRGAFD